MGRPAFPFIGQGKAWIIVEGKEENEKEKKSSRIAGSFFSFTRSRRPCSHQQGQLHVAALSIIGAMRRRRLLVVALHSVLVDVVVNRRACQSSYKG